MKIINNLLLKHLACGYVLFCKYNKNDTLSFEEYCNKYSLCLKVHLNVIDDIVNSAKTTMKKEKKKFGKKVEK